jgi:hypothetical protein
MKDGYRSRPNQESEEIVIIGHATLIHRPDGSLSLLGCLGIDQFLQFQEQIIPLQGDLYDRIAVITQPVNVQFIFRTTVLKTG